MRFPSLLYSLLTDLSTETVDQLHCWADETINFLASKGILLYDTDII
jgi:hypothetical protein